jgi:hypothetical protein
MFFRTLKFLSLMAFSLPAIVNAMPDANDLVIAYHIPHHKKHVLFQSLVQNAIPGKVVPDDYHVTLGIVRNVNNTDAGSLRRELESISDTHLNNATFTATAAKRYLVNRMPDRSPIVLSPRPEEIARFRGINVALHNHLQSYNTRMGKGYVFHGDTVPAAYDPHITLVNRHHIQHWALDRDQLLNRINTRLNGTSLELLQRPVPHVQPRPAPQSRPVPQLRRQARHTHVRHVHHHRPVRYAPRRTHVKQVHRHRPVRHAPRRRHR